MVMDDHPPLRIEPSRRTAIFVVVLLLHLLLFYWLAMSRSPASPPVAVPVFDITLFRPTGGGGGAPREPQPAATISERQASAVHVPVDPTDWHDLPPAPAEPAPPTPTFETGAATQPTLAVSAEPEPAADTAAAQADPGLAGTGRGGGAGSGVGAGTGAGSGRGRGSGAGVVLIRAPAGATVTQDVSMTHLAGLAGGYGVLRCRIRLSQRLEGCRVLREYPVGSGLGRLAQQRAGEFRFRPPQRNGRFRDEVPITVAIAFPPELLASQTP